MKNWKTTIAGLAAGFAALQAILAAGGNIADIKTWALPVILAIWGAIAKDFNVSGGAVKLLLFSSIALPLSSCSVGIGPNGQYTAGVAVTSSDLKTISETILAWKKAQADAGQPVQKMSVRVSPAAPTDPTQAQTVVGTAPAPKPSPAPTVIATK